MVFNVNMLCNKPYSIVPVNIVYTIFHVKSSDFFNKKTDETTSVENNSAKCFT